MDHIQLLNYLISRFRLQSYLEIGCATNYCFERIQAAEKVGVDPESGGTHRCTSDDFFQRLSQSKKFDLVFIDGLHECKQVDRDIQNSLDHLSPQGIIVLHDCNPELEVEGTYPADPKIWSTPGSRGWWNGDVWKAIAFWRTKSYVDLSTADFDCGCGIIRLRPNTDPYQLSKKYVELQWGDLVRDRKSLLRLKNWEEIQKWL